LSIQHLKAIVFGVFRNFSDLKVSVQGDFNAKWMPDITAFLVRQWLFPFIHKVLPKHYRRESLDQIFTNMPELDYQLSEEPFSDHMEVAVELEFVKGDKNLDLGSIPTKVSQRDIRLAFTPKEAKQMIIENPGILQGPPIYALPHHLEEESDIPLVQPTTQVFPL
jgi:hypothetical protein